MTRSAFMAARAPVRRSTTTIPYGGVRPATKPLTTACNPPDSVGASVVVGLGAAVLVVVGGRAVVDVVLVVGVVVVDRDGLVVVLVGARTDDGDDPHAVATTSNVTTIAEPLTAMRRYRG